MKYFDNVKEVSISGKALIELLLAVHEKGAEFQFKAAGKSMLPTIYNNDTLNLSPLRGIPPYRGEVVGFRHPLTRNLIIHRIIKADKNVFTIRGDHLKISDSDIPLEDIVGVVTRVERQGKPLIWPDRFKNSFRARIYFRFYLFYLKIQRDIKNLLRFF